ncbi:MAG: hypothetical protein ABIZ36_02850 [Gemmatimonadaceae bacterium]
MNNSAKKFVSIGVALSFLQLTACQAYGPMVRPDNGAQIASGNATVTRTDGTQTVLHDVSVAGDTLRGFESRGFNNRVSIPLQAVAGVQITHVDRARTGLLIVGVTVTALAGLLIWSLAVFESTLCDALSGASCK